MKTGNIEIKKKLLLPLENDAITPTLAFGDGDSGFYESADDVLMFSLAGTARLQFSAGLYTVTGRSCIYNEASSATAPNLLPSVDDVNTGIGRAAADALSIIAGGVEGHRITETAGAIDHVLTGIVKTPTTQTLTGAGAVDIVSAITHLVTAGVGDALTLADGAEGQTKTILLKTLTTAGDTSIVTPTNFANGTYMTFNTVNDLALLLFTNGKWYLVSVMSVTPT